MLGHGLMTRCSSMHNRPNCRERFFRPKWTLSELTDGRHKGRQVHVGSGAKFLLGPVMARIKSLGLVLMFVLMSMTGFASLVAASGATDSDLQAQNITVTWDSTYEYTRIHWDNLDTSDFQVMNDLQVATYQVYRSSSPINTSDIEDGNLTHFASIPACEPEWSVGNCRNQERSVIYLTPHSSEGSYHYAVTTILGDGSEKAFVEMNVSQNYEAVNETSHAITSVFNLNATYDGVNQQTILEWENTVPVFFPGQLIETGQNAYTIRIYEHPIPANRTNWGQVNPTLIAQDIPAGTNSYSISVPSGVDRNVYYTATIVDQGFEDFRLLTQNSLLNSVREDSRAPAPAIEVAASFSAIPETGFGTTTIVWNDDPIEDGNEHYRIWRSPTPFGQNVSGAQLIGEVAAGEEKFDYTIQQGVLAESYYAVSVVDWIGNHDGLLSSGSTSTLIFEDTFNPWIAEPTNVTAVYDNGMTTITWSDQMGAEGENYHVYRSVGSRLTSASDLVNDSNVDLVATVPDGVQIAQASVPDGVYQNTYYCVTSEARYGYVNGTYEDTRFIQNCSDAILEDTQDPRAPQMSSPMLEVMAEPKYVLVTWLNDFEEVDESYGLWVHPGNPWGIEDWEDEPVLTTNATVEDGWTLLETITEPSASTTQMYRSIDVDDEIDRYRWYAVTQTDQWGNENTVVSNEFNAWLVHEDTTAPTAIITVEGEDDNDEDFIAEALTQGDYELLFKVNEELGEDPIINVTTTGGHAFTEEGGLVRAEKVPGKADTYRLRMTVPSGLVNSNLHVEYTLVDVAGNTRTEVEVGWPIDVEDPDIQMYSPGPESTYLYGEYVRVHGSVTDDVGVEFVRIKFEKGLDQTSIIRTEWFNVTDITAIDDGGKTFVFEYLDPAASWPEKGRQRLIIEAGDSAGNVEEVRITFIVDLCQRSTSGYTVCATEVADMQVPDDDNDGVPNDEDSCPSTVRNTEVDPATGCISPGMFSGTFLLVYVMGGLNLILLLAAIVAASMANANPARKRRGDEEDMLDEDDWMADFMGGGDTGSADDVRADLGALNEKSEEKKESDTKQVEEDDDLFQEKVARPKRRTKRKVKDDDDDDDDDDEGGSRPRVRRRSVRRRSS